MSDERDEKMAIKQEALKKVKHVSDEKAKASADKMLKKYSEAFTKMAKN